VQSALREMPEATRLVLVEMLSTTLEMLGTSNGLKTEKAIAIAAKRLTDEFGHFTIEDWRLCLYEMEAGRSVKHYNNTNLEWLINCFQAYDERKVEVMRQIHRWRSGRRPPCTGLTLSIRWARANPSPWRR
jgi:hypothetical protein